MKSLVLSVALSLGTAAASAQVPLKDVTTVSEGLIATGMAIRISERCDSLEPRVVRGIAYLNSLRQHARDLGYSTEEIDAYIDDKEEERRLIAVAEARLASKGAVEGQPETFCTVGRAEMAADSATGRLLR